MGFAASVCHPPTLRMLISFADEGLAAGLDRVGCHRVDHVVAVGGDLVVQALRRVRKQVPVLVDLRKARPKGTMIFGGRQQLERRRKGLNRQRRIARSPAASADQPRRQALCRQSVATAVTRRKRTAASRGRGHAAGGVRSRTTAYCRISLAASSVHDCCHSVLLIPICEMHHTPPNGGPGSSQWLKSVRRPSEL
jgi:hypothetical protein